METVEIPGVDTRVWRLLAVQEGYSAGPREVWYTGLHEVCVSPLGSGKVYHLGGKYNHYPEATDSYQTLCGPRYLRWCPLRCEWTPTGYMELRDAPPRHLPLCGSCARQLPRL